MNKGRGRVTLSDVATAAGVSIATVSKALNGRADVAPATRDRISQAIAETGYTGSKNRRDSSHTIEFLVDKLTSPYAMEVLRGVTLAAEKENLDVVVARFRPDGTRDETEVIRRLIAMKRKGAIVVTAKLSERAYSAITNVDLPIVFVDPLTIENDSMVSVGSTNWIGGRSATEHLIQLGHTRLAIIAGPSASLSARARVDGFRSALEFAGLSIHPDFIQYRRFSHDAAHHVAQEWLVREDRPTAIVASSDEQAMGVLEAARGLSLLVPEDLSLVGYDDTYVASWSNPPLTAVYQPLQDIGRMCVQSIVRLGRGEELDSHHIELATQLVVRESTAPPASIIKVGARPPSPAR